MRDLSSAQLAKMTLPDLRGLAKELGLTGYSRLRKQTLVETLAKQMRADALARRAVASVVGRADPPGADAEPSREAAPAPSSSTTTTLIDEPAPAAVAAAAGPAQDDPGAMRDAAWYPPALPETYGRDRLTLMVRDPHWLFCYWEVGEALLAAAGEGLAGSRWRVLRVHLLGDADEVLDGWEHGLGNDAVSWYVRTGRPGARFRAELGLRDCDGRYRRLIKSETVTAPMDAPSERWDEEWVGLSRDSWEELERAARPYPASMSGAESIKRALRGMASANFGSEIFFASKTKKASSTR